MATSGFMKCPEQNPKHVKQSLEPHGLAGSGTGNGRYDTYGPLENHLGRSREPALQRG